MPRQIPERSSNTYTKSHQALYMREIEKRPIKEISKRLNSSEGSVRVMLCNARQNKVLTRAFLHDRNDILSTLQERGLSAINSCFKAAETALDRHHKALKAEDVANEEGNPILRSKDIISAHGLSNLMSALYRTTESLYNMEKSEAGERGTGGLSSSISSEVQKQIDAFHQNNLVTPVIDVTPQPTDQPQD